MSAWWTMTRLPAPEPPIAPDLDELCARIVRVAVSNIGYGETTANNEGRFIDLIGGKAEHEWCAAFAGHCYQRAHDLLSLRLPFERSLGAKRLTKNCGAVGRLFTDPLQARPGDLICWHRRTGPISWKGHVGIVDHVDEDGLIHSIEGNVGRYPSKVRPFVHDVTKERLWRFASLRRET